jgi:hypothetical protein
MLRSLIIVAQQLAASIRWMTLVERPPPLAVWFFHLTERNTIASTTIHPTMTSADTALSLSFVV